MTRGVALNKVSATGVSALALIAACGSAMAAEVAASPSASTTGAETSVGEIVVTAQRKQESLQDVPIAVSAFSGKTLKIQRLDGGQNLEIAIPNVNFSRSNFGGYNFSIRGVGNKVGGAGSTGGVSFNVNEFPLAKNNFSDTDFYDVERVEVLRGPQGTLYGRNATGGAVDVITAKPTQQWGASVTGEYGNFDSRKLTGFVNAPLGNMFALRVAGFTLDRDGFGVNSVTGDRVDGRKLEGARVTLAFTPNDRFHAALMYDYFGEDDNRNRVGKQLCIKDPGPAVVGGVAVSANNALYLSQGCLPGSLYSNTAYGTVNSNATLGGIFSNTIGLTSGDVFANHPMQNHNLNDIESSTDPTYSAHDDLLLLTADYKLTDALTISSTTGTNLNSLNSNADYNRLVPLIPFNTTNPFFPGGVVLDPQVGTSNQLRTYENASNSTREFTQELRLTSSFAGPLNFVVGGLYSQSTFLDNLIIQTNPLTALSQENNALGGAILGGNVFVDPSRTPSGFGHNYFASPSHDRIITRAAFGELYYRVSNTLRLTGGLRYNVDQRDSLVIPIELLSPGSGFPTTQCPAGTSANSCITHLTAYFRAVTGRANIEWTPQLPFTDHTQVYLSYSRGYKGGGFNGACQTGAGSCGVSATYHPETVDAFEIGTKNTALDGRLTVNADTFFYNYTGYQISKIVNQSSSNENINAQIFGAELETIFEPVKHLTVNANLGYLHTKITSGSSIDTLNLSQGDPTLSVIKGSIGSNCVVTTAGLANLLAVQQGQPGAPSDPNVTGNAGALLNACSGTLGPAYSSLYNYGPNVQTSLNGAEQVGDGVPVNLRGKQLPNSPDFTVSLGAQYVAYIGNDWTATVRGDYYWQAQSYSRIYNGISDRLQSWDNVNATLTFANLTAGLNIQLYVKNALNNQPLTDTYVTDPTSGLFTNVFTLEPRTFGVSVTKRF